MASQKPKPGRKTPPSQKASRYRFVVSACLAGIDCNFKGGNALSKKVKELFEAGTALAACPEVAGGLGSPRERCEICRGGGAEVLNGTARVFSSSGKDNTIPYIRGAARIAGIVKSLGIKKAILKSGSPSCGPDRIYDGTFSGKSRSGNGVFAAMLKQGGIRLYSDKYDMKRNT